MANPDKNSAQFLALDFQLCRPDTDFFTLPSASAECFSLRFFHSFTVTCAINPQAPYCHEKLKWDRKK